ncbi:MAG: hypothetical protein Kow0010_26480 [Dehalococcoidia bacterium]
MDKGAEDGIATHHNARLWLATEGNVKRLFAGHVVQRRRKPFVFRGKLAVKPCVEGSADEDRVFARASPIAGHFDAYELGHWTRLA